jgi:hypothetical protein
MNFTGDIFGVVEESFATPDVADSIPTLLKNKKLQQKITRHIVWFENKLLRLKRLRSTC